MTMNGAARIVSLDPENPSDVLRLARAQWDQGCVTGRSIEDLSTNLRNLLLDSSRELLRDLAGRPA